MVDNNLVIGSFKVAQYDHLPIYRKSFNLSIHLENTVPGFSRHTEYTLGTDLGNFRARLYN